MESKQVLQFAEMVRQAVPHEGIDLMVWLGSLEQVRKGTLPDMVADDFCPACHGPRAHTWAMIGNWEQYTCLECGFKHSEQLTTRRS